MHAAEQNHPDVAEARIEWRNTQPSLHPGELIFIDQGGPALWTLEAWHKAD